MRKKILMALVVPLVAAWTLQAAAASERHHTRMKARAAPTEQWWNSYPYEPPGYGSNAYESPGYLASDDEDAMSSGIVGH